MTSRGEGLIIERLWEDGPAAEPSASVTSLRGGPLPVRLAARYPGTFGIALRRDRLTVAANLVSSIDGVVALGPTENSTGGAEISGHSAPDQFVMALLRALADVVIVGAGTVRVGRNHEWTARKLQPELAGVFADWREALGLAPQPTTVVVSVSGDLDPTHRGLCAPDVPVIVATTPAGADRLQSRELPPNLRVVVAGSESVLPSTLVEFVGREGCKLALCEGGPHLIGELAAAQLLDELFLTVAPQLVGRTGRFGRLGLVEGRDLLGQGGRWARLNAVHRAGDDLFLRYRFGGQDHHLGSGRPGGSAANDRGAGLSGISDPSPARQGP